MFSKLNIGPCSANLQSVSNNLQAKSELIVVMSMATVNPGRDQVIRVTVACGVLATLAVCLRLVARWRSKAVIAADDWFMVASLIPSYGMLAVGSISMSSDPAYPPHANEVSDHERERWSAFGYLD